MIIDWNKPVQTRDGRKARVLCTDRKGASPVVALIDFPGKEIIGFYDEYGRRVPSNAGRGADLINVPERVERWVNLYPDSVGSVVIHRSHVEADVCAEQERTGLLKLTYEGDKAVAVELVEGGDA